MNTPHPASRHGLTAMTAFDAAPEGEKSALREWLARLPTLMDHRLNEATRLAIRDRAIGSLFLSNTNHLRCRVVAAYREAGLRHVAEGHAESCGGPTLFDEALAHLAAEHGYPPPFRVGECHCRLPDSRRGGR